MDFYRGNNKAESNYGFKYKDINSQECRFHALYLVDNETGSLFVSNRYSDNIRFLRDDLICGFLKAISQFISELKEGVSEELQEINFRNTRILYERKGRLLAIAITKKSNLQIERGILHEIVQDFYFRFKGFINNFNGEIKKEVIGYKKRLKSINLNSLFRYNTQI